jgi:hypothetical protein
MTTVAPKPPWAPSVWKNTRGEIFAQFEDGHVLKFIATEGGLSKLLKLVPCVEAQPGYISGHSNFERVTSKKIKIARKTASRREVVKASDEQRRAADEVIKKMRPK